MNINHIGLSSGKDSTALEGWAIHESGYSRESLRFTFADTQNEFEEVYRQIETLNDYAVKHGCAPVRTLRSEGFLALVMRKKRFPSACARFCTEWLKINPLIHYIEELHLDGHEVLTHAGVRASESTERSVLSEYGFDEWIKCPVRRPLLNRSIQDIWDMHRKYGLPINPLYFKGRKRVGCRLCCMSAKRDIRVCAKKSPEVIDEYERWEKAVGLARGGEYASFIPADKVPERFRTKTYTNKKGVQFSVASIRDAVRWSQTLKGGKDIGFDFMYQEDDSHLPCQSGYCE